MTTHGGALGFHRLGGPCVGFDGKGDMSASEFKGQDEAECQILESATSAKLTRKRRHVVEDDEDMLEKIGQSKDATTETRGDTADSNVPRKQRLTLLGVESACYLYHKFLLSEEVFSSVPKSPSKLDTARANTPEGKHLRITDSKIRKEETIIQAIDCPEYGILEPLHTCDLIECLAILGELTTLYNFSLSMPITTPEAAIISHISEVDFDPVTLVAPTSSLGTLIREYLGENLHAIFQDGEAYEYVKTLGGAAFNGQLVGVLAEGLLARKLGSGKTVKVEIDL
ncbi:hypothetical protein B0A55_06176 [Friedmanniomyces simplex]|uniref:Uncharacterized protein n=1 Tax=Friedmanniomyces simplex TaxID=329884 RepID=A0A4U0XFB6_9PEZI|nr:hypothetical protein B0A55_06176 [Friedmanniomyces simplex]